MTANSKIEWTHHTFNPWWGCQRVSPGCEHCYAETFAKRTGHKVWGPESAGVERRFFGDKHWAEPLKWNASAAKRGVRERVFCASMADVFEDRVDLLDQRDRLFRVIHDTPWLDWLLLTKRPENIRRFMPAKTCERDDICEAARWDGVCCPEDQCDRDWGGRAWPQNIWLGCTAEDQQRADQRIPHLLTCKPLAAKLFVSYEPALERVDFKLPKRAIVTMTSVSPEYSARTGIKVGDKVEHRTALDWIIVGGESGPGARPFNLAWARSTIEQCRAAGVAVHVKQIGPHPFERAEAWGEDAGGYDPKNLLARADAPRPPQMEGWTRVRTATETAWYRYHRVKDRKGGDMDEWPEDLRVREYPL